MEKPQRRMVPVICFAVILLGAAAFSLCLAAEFKRVKVRGASCHTIVIISQCFSLSSLDLTHGVCFVGQGYEIGWKPLFSAKKPCIRPGHRCGRLPRCSADYRDHGGSDQAVRRRQEVEEKPNSAHRPLGFILVTISSLLHKSYYY